MPRLASWSITELKQRSKEILNMDFWNVKEYKTREYNTHEIALFEISEELKIRRVWAD